MDKIKSVLLITAIAGSIGVVGTLGVMIPNEGIEISTFEEKKIEDCDGKFVQYYDEGDSYYCASSAQYDEDWPREMGKIQDNTSISDDYKFLYLVAKNDTNKRDALKREMVTKYDTKTHTFIGKEFDGDFNNQLWFAAQLANMECDGGCELIGDTMNEKIYNIIK